MTKNEFIELSEKEVKSLNGCNNEETFESWRAGYIYAQNIVRESLNIDYNGEFCEKMENFSNEDLEIFKFNVE